MFWINKKACLQVNRVLKKHKVVKIYQSLLEIKTLTWKSIPIS